MVQSRFRFWLFVSLVAAAVVPIHAGISGFDSIELVGPNGKIAENCQWPPPTRYVADGVELPPGGKSVIQSGTKAVGLAYRPSCSVSVSMDVVATEPSGLESLAGEYRYSSDRVHWSEWKPFSGKTQAKITPPPTFVETVAVTREDCDRFSELAKKWGKPSETEAQGTDAYFRWLARKDPGIFAKAIPVVGYIQLRIRNTGARPVVVKSASGHIFTYTSGWSRPDEDVDFHTPWHFDLSEFSSTTQPTSQPARPD